ECASPFGLQMADNRVGPGTGVVTIGLERFFALASLVCFFSISLIWFNSRPGHESDFASIKLVGNLMLAAAILGIIALIIYQRKSESIIAWFVNVTDRKFIPPR